MPGEGFWRATLSADTKPDAGDNAQKPLKSFFGIRRCQATWFY
jgi:hypothetical protein